MMESKDKLVAIFSYLIFFLPFLRRNPSKFNRFHGNQGLILFILFWGIYIMGRCVPIIGMYLFYPIGGLLCFLCLLFGMVTAANGKMKEFPIIGGIKFIK